jgi:hypothetical protein
MSTLRLLKVIVQPVFAIDDGDTLTETSAEPIVVSPSDWPTYATTRFIEACDKLQAELDEAVDEAIGVSAQHS